MAAYLESALYLAGGFMFLWHNHWWECGEGETGGERTEVVTLDSGGRFHLLPSKQESDVPSVPIAFVGGKRPKAAKLGRVDQKMQPFLG